MKTRVLDSWPIIEWMKARKPASDLVRQLLSDAEQGRSRLLISAINVGEVYYFLCKEHSQADAERWRIHSFTLPLTIEAPTLAEIWSAAFLKGTFPISYADAFAAALAQKYKCAIVTGDPDFHRVEGLEVDWIGPPIPTQSDNSALPL